MITITIEGPVGSGKSTLGRIIRNSEFAYGKKVTLKEEATDATIAEMKPDILIITRVHR